MAHKSGSFEVSEGTPMTERHDDDRPEPQPRGGNMSIYKNNEGSRKKARQLRNWKIIAIIFMILTAGLIAGIIAVALTGGGEQSTAAAAAPCKSSQTSLMQEKNSTCKPKAKSANKNSRSDQIFKGLSLKEMDEIVDFVMKEKSLNLVPAANATTRDNYIYSVEEQLPDKSAVIDWLDRKTSSRPIRKARVILFMGKQRKVAEYIVEPIPSPRTKNKVSNSPTWKSRPVCNVVETKEVLTLVVEEIEDKISAIFFESFTDGKCKHILNCTYANVAVRAVLNSSNRHLIVWFYLGTTIVADYYMYPLPFYIVVSVAEDSYKYEIVAVYYNNNKYADLEHLKTKYYEKDFNQKYTLPNIKTRIGVNGSPDYIKKGSNEQTQRPPQSYTPDGARFSVTGRHVEWLGWEFNIHPRTLTGLQIFDVKYDNERIAYELSMQDVVVLYSGNAPDDFFKNYFDNGWTIGRYNLPLVRGVDCPADAIYLNSTVYSPGEDHGIELNDAICVFEHRNAVPLRRHYSAAFFEWGYRYAFSMPDSVLIARQVLTIWNYDYVFDYEFHQNGMIEIKVSSTGYVAVTNNIPSTTVDRGYVINPDWRAVANLHQHLFNFKIDLDVAGKMNRFKTVEIESQRQQTVYSGSETWSQMVTKETEIKRESESALSYDFDRPKQYIIYNNDKELYRNSGVDRGYRIFSNGFSKVVLPNDHPLLKGGASWAKYQIAVTKHETTEQGTASYFVQGDPFDAYINFDDFFDDNHSLEDTDLVVWVTVGLHHLPTYEDLPVTTTPGKTLSIGLAPFNYFKRDPSVHSRDAAVFWNSALNKTNDYLHKNITCLPSNSKPMIHV